MKLINPLVILYILSTILFIEAVSFLFCLPVAFIYNESPDPFIWSSLIAISLSVILYLISRKSASEKIHNREGFLAVSLVMAGSFLYRNITLSAEWINYLIC